MPEFKILRAGRRYDFVKEDFDFGFFIHVAPAQRRRGPPFGVARRYALVRNMLHVKTFVLG
jgi:hypothetical protein